MYITSKRNIPSVAKDSNRRRKTGAAQPTRPAHRTHVPVNPGANPPSRLPKDTLSLVNLGFNPPSSRLLSLTVHSPVNLGPKGRVPKRTKTRKGDKETETETETLARMDQQLAEVEADVARFQQKRKRYNVMERAHFRAYTDNLVLDLAAKLASLMSSKERMNHGDILWVKNGTCKHSTARLMRFAATLTDKDLEKHNIPHKYLKCLKELKMHRVTQAEGSRGSEAALAALLLTPPYVNSECFELWAPLLPFVYGYAVHELAARFWNPPFCS